MFQILLLVKRSFLPFLTDLVLARHCKKIAKHEIGELREKFSSLKRRLSMVPLFKLGEFEFATGVHLRARQILNKRTSLQTELIIRLWLPRSKILSKKSLVLLFFHVKPKKLFLLLSLTFPLHRSPTIDSEKSLSHTIIVLLMCFFK